MSDGHHPVLRTVLGGGWSVTVTVDDKTYHTEAEFPTEALYKLTIQLADDLDESRAAVRGLVTFLERYGSEDLNGTGLPGDRNPLTMPELG